jgi:hypothetical protein
MYVSKGCKTQGNEKVRMLALFNTLTEEDKNFVISMTTSLVRKYGIFLKAKMHKTGQKKT